MLSESSVECHSKILITVIGQEIVFINHNENITQIIFVTFCSNPLNSKYS